jgi:hypothetical protein
MKRRPIRILTTEIASYLAPSFLVILNRKLVPRCVCSEHQLSTFGLVQTDSRFAGRCPRSRRPQNVVRTSELAIPPTTTSRITNRIGTNRAPASPNRNPTHPPKSRRGTHATRGKMNHPDRSGRRSTYHHHPPTLSIYRHGRKPRRNRAKTRHERGA